MKTALALILILVLVFFTGLFANCFPFVKVAEANPYGNLDKTKWRIESPKNHTVYTNSVLNFSFKCTTHDLWDEYDYGLPLEYCIDGSDYWEELEDGNYMHVTPPDKERIFIKAALITDPDASIKTFQYSTLLPSLSDGEHKLTIYFSFKSWGPDNPQFTSTRYTSIIFYIDTLAPKITNLSVNGTGTVDRLLNFTVDEEISWVGYSLDNQANVTITGDAFLKDLPVGSHNVTVYAEDTIGHMGASETLYFTVAEEEEIDTFSISLVPASVFPVAAVCICFGLLIYLIKRK